MSLRARLALTVVVITLGVALAGGAVISLYTRRYLDGHLDDQLRALRGPALRDAASRFYTGPADPIDGTPRQANVFDLSRAYVELRDAENRVIVTGFLRSADGAARPALPASTPGLAQITPANQPFGQPTAFSPPRARIFEVGSTGPGVHTNYRVQLSVSNRNQVLSLVALPTTERDNTLHRLLLIEALCGIAAAMVVAGGAWWIVGRQLRPLEEIGDIAGHIADGDLSVRVPEGRTGTEVGRLSRSLNGMLTQIESAFEARRSSEESLRRFVADASHELRTPLTSIKGYAELIERNGDMDPNLAGHGVNRIRSEANRMTALVDDLLTLTRLDQGRPLTLETVDLQALARDIAGDAMAGSGQWPVTVAATGPVPVIGDRNQLTQVMANLVGNAMVHTPIGTSIEIMTTTDGDRAHIRVVDHGPGLPSGTETAVFERFWRADPARVRSLGAGAGAGLGLSIVRAIVTAHHGTVHAEQTEGGGATFVVELPEAGPPPVVTMNESVPPPPS
jgi:two-component system OmpR family sensor kinase